ncbi:MAG: hypothetical protein ACRCXE_01390 [Metamycoplasmataceae bacterium]
MNKKLLLSLGAPILTVLPFAAVVSCSAETTIYTESDRFDITVQTKDKSLLAWDSVEMIEDAATQEDKLNVLEVLANVPKIAKGFELVIEEARKVPYDWRSLYVRLSIFETTKPNVKSEAVFSVEGFKADPIEIEIAKFKDSKQATESISASEAVQIVDDAIDKAQGQAVVLDALKTFVNVPAVSPEFELNIMLAEINPDSNTSVDVTIWIIDRAIPYKNDSVTFTITGFLPSF